MTKAHNKQEQRNDSEQLGEPVAYLHDDGSWTAAKTDAGRKLNDEVLFIGALKIGVYTTPPQQRKLLTDEQRKFLRDAFAKALTSVYVCNSGWEAWDNETMTEIDFEPAWECEKVLGALIEAVQSSRSKT